MTKIETPIKTSETSLLRFITCGSVDDGKSTLIGRMLFDAGQVFEDQLDALDDASNKFGTQGKERDYALLVDGLSAEREQGITIDVAYRYFRTKNRAFIVADTPGHEQYTRNMATGASTAEVAILLIDARKGVLAQTRRHALIVSMIGVKNVVLAVNKMDLVYYSQDTFNAIVKDFSQHAQTLGFDEIKAIPMAAVNGENIASNSSNMAWYTGQTLLDYLEKVQPKPAQNTIFRMPVQWVNRPNLDFRGFSGTIATGTVKVGQLLRVSSSGQTSKVQSIVTYDGKFESAKSEQAITITLEDEIDVSRGDVLSDANDSLRPRNYFNAKILWMSQEAMRLSKDYVIKCATSQTNAKVIAISEAVDFETLTSKPANGLQMNGIGDVEIGLSRPLLLDAYKNNRDLGSFILIDKITHETVALGLVQGQTIIPIAKEVPFFEGLAQKLVPDAENPAELANSAVKWYSVSSIVTFAIALLVTQNLWVSLILGLLEFAIKPLVQAWHLRKIASDKANKLAQEEANIDGSGI